MKKIKIKTKLKKNANELKQLLEEAKDDLQHNGVGGLLLKPSELIRGSFYLIFINFINF